MWKAALPDPCTLTSSVLKIHNSWLQPWTIIQLDEWWATATHFYRVLQVIQTLDSVEKTFDIVATNSILFNELPKIIIQINVLILF